MEFMFMDESGKNILTQLNQDIYIFGGLIINKENVFLALDAFKTIYQEHRNALKQELKNKISTPDKGMRIQEMLFNFELHASNIFNPNKMQMRNGKLIRENPWRFYPASKRFKMIHDLFISITPYITKINMFRAEKTSYIEYCKQNNIIPNNDSLDEKMIKFIINEYNDWLCMNNKKGTLITDRLDSNIRDKFVHEIHISNHQQYWSEPITVDSQFNAFTQIIDIITYCYYITSIKATHKDNYNAIEKVFNLFIKPIMEEKDLVCSLS